MVNFCLEQLKKEHICKVALNAFINNEAGNAFWQRAGWILRNDMNYYDHVIEPDNITIFNE
jgi:hypothetical protein